MDFSDRVILIFALASILSLGLLSLVRCKSRICNEIAFSEEFINKLVVYVESNGCDSESYGWLTRRSSKMQKILGAYGVYASYRPPYAGFQFRDYPVIINMLPELRMTLESNFLSRGDLTRQYAVSLQETILRYIGVLEDRDNELFKCIRNPVAGFREGVRIIMALPLSILEWLGALSDKTVSALISSRVFKLLTAFISLVGFVSAVIGIVLGWNQFLLILRGLIKSFW
jgi:hypothetical protein